MTIQYQTGPYNIVQDHTIIHILHNRIILLIFCTPGSYCSYFTHRYHFVNILHNMIKLFIFTHQDHIAHVLHTGIIFFFCTLGSNYSYFAHQDHIVHILHTRIILFIFCRNAWVRDKCCQGCHCEAVIWK